MMKRRKFDNIRLINVTNFPLFKTTKPMGKSEIMPLSVITPKTEAHFSFI
jgi:hypothetical protein